MEEAIKNIGIKIQEIKELSFSNKLFDGLAENFDEENVDIKLGYAVRGESDKKNISIYIIIHFIYKTEKSSKLKEFLKLETNTTFKVQDYTDDDIKFINDDNEIFINDELMYVFLNTAIGATRGMLAYKMASLPINLVLPLFDMDQLIPSKKPENNIKKKSKK